MVFSIATGVHMSTATEEHFRRLTNDWQMIADLAFSDLVLWHPGQHPRSNDTTGFIAVAQARPFTAQTTLHRDIVGSSPRVGLKPLVQQAWMTAEPVNPSEVPNPGSSLGVAVWPVVRNGLTVAVITVHQNLTSQRIPSQLEAVYRHSAEDLLRMTSSGLWPETEGHSPTVVWDNPRVGDGLVRVDAQGLVTFASPNAISALRKLGISEQLEGRQLSRLTLDYVDQRRPVDENLPAVLFGRSAGRATIDLRSVSLSLRAVPLRCEDERYGALVLLREVTEIRRRDLKLRGKDATIREVHHRVKNNLQTVGSLLRMQSRRMGTAESRRGLEQAMQRVDTIALVHETMSHTTDDDLDMDALLHRQFKLAVEVGSATGTVETVISGSFGMLPGEMATPLALVINELATNAVEHGTSAHGGAVELETSRNQADSGIQLVISMRDDGAVSSEATTAGRTNTIEVSGTGLGLQIVSTLVESDLGGTIEWLPRLHRGEPTGGTEARIVVPVPEQ